MSVPEYREDIKKVRRTSTLVGCLFRAALLVSLACSILNEAPAWPMGRRPPEEYTSPLSLKPPPSEPLTLVACYRLALEQSETVAIHNEAIEETEAEYFKATSEALGDVNFVMTQFRQDVRDSGDSSTVGGTLAKQLKRERKFVMSQPVFQGFKALAALNAAGALRKQRTQERIRAEQLLFMDVARAFYGVLRFKKDLEVIEEIRKLFLERIEELETRQAIGRSRPSEVVTAESRMKLIEADAAASRGELKRARHNLEFLTGTAIDENALVDETIPEENAKALETYLTKAEERADVEASRQATRIARQGIVSSQSDLWPEITVDTNVFEKREGFQSGIDWDVLFTIDIPLFQGGEAIGNVKESVSTWKQFKLSERLSEREAGLEIKQAYESWVSSLERHRALEDAALSAEQNFLLQKEDYERNLVGNLDVLEALESLNETRREASDAHYRMKENFWSLRTAVGEIL